MPRSKQNHWRLRTQLACLAFIFSLVVLAAFAARAALNDPLGDDVSIQVEGSIALCNGKQAALDVPFEIVVSVTASGNDPRLEIKPPQVNWPSYLVLDPRKSSQASHSRSKNGTETVVKSFTYSVKARGEPRKVTIGAFPVSYQVRGLSEDRVLVIPGFSFDVVAQETAKRIVLALIPVSSFLVLLVGAGIAALVFMKRRRSAKHNDESQSADVPDAPVGESLECCFYKELASAQKRWLAGDGKEYFAEVESHLHTYLRQKYHVRQHDNSADYIQALCHAGVESVRASRLVRLLDMCQEVRFSPQVPSAPEQNRFQRELEEVVRSCR